jgi:hypothetical protein
MRQRRINQGVNTPDREKKPALRAVGEPVIEFVKSQKPSYDTKN